jgi:hypothetical protein
MAQWAPALLDAYIHALIDTLKVNTSQYVSVKLMREHELFRESIIPYLETNQLWQRLLAIQKIRPSTIAMTKPAANLPTLATTITLLFPLSLSPLGLLLITVSLLLVLLPPTVDQKRKPRP